VDGRIKMHVMHRALQARAEFREVFETGDYVGLETRGARKDSLFAFARKRPPSSDNRAMTITCVPRLIASLMPDGATPPLGPAVWKDTCVELWGADNGSPVETFREVFTGATIVPDRTATGRSINAAALFDTFPVALLVPSSP
jgi:(1->4)-alpha-D-glucan 1-alpha-D-glucosylmutase